MYFRFPSTFAISNPLYFYTEKKKCQHIFYVYIPLFSALLVRISIFLLTKRTCFANFQFLKFLCDSLFKRSSRNSSYTFYPNHMKTLFLYYQYYKTLFLPIISRIMSFQIYYIISTNFIYVFLFFANKMQTMFTFIYEVSI